MITGQLKSQAAILVPVGVLFGSCATRNYLWRIFVENPKQNRNRLAPFQHDRRLYHERFNFILSGL